MHCLLLLLFYTVLAIPMSHAQDSDMPDWRKRVIKGNQEVYDLCKTEADAAQAERKASLMESANKSTGALRESMLTFAANVGDARDFKGGIIATIDGMARNGELEVRLEEAMHGNSKRDAAIRCIAPYFQKKVAEAMASGKQSAYSTNRPSSPPPSPTGASFDRNTNTATSQTTDSSRSKVIAGDGRSAMDCVALIQIAKGDSKMSGGGRVIANNCSGKVEVTWCYVDEECDRGRGGTWTLGVGRSWPVSQERLIRWGACHGANTIAFEKGSSGLRFICKAPSS